MLYTKGYKYQLQDPVTYMTPFHVKDKAHAGKFITLNASGLLLIHAGYAWDGASGPAIDTKTFIKGSLIHDALYQLIRYKILYKKDRITCDKILRDVCIEQGMSKIRAWWVYHGLKVFGGAAAAPRNRRKIIEI